ncbi:MAG: DUF5829 family protein [Sphingobacteriales bacterium JAD_PAG50586_3]|nr:MAG: DUF5829 family protein [Sphingobacteriales bacterium JAD_PAG50586_3]
MKKILILLLLVFNAACFAQTAFKVDCNTIFICVDSATYKSLSAVPYLRDTLAVFIESATTTNAGSYQGKYLLGKSATIEFIQPKNTGLFGDSAGDVGLELKTRLLGQQADIIKSAQQQGLMLDTSSVTIPDSAGAISWYNAVSVKSNAGNFEFSTLEYQRDYLKYMGFDDVEIAAPMTYDYFNTKLSGGRQYPKQFSAIKSAAIVATKKDIDLIRQFFSLNNFKSGKNSFTNGDFTLYYTIDNQAVTTCLKNIKLVLLKEQSPRIISISDNLEIHVKGKEATLLFKQ